MDRHHRLTHAQLKRIGANLERLGLEDACAGRHGRRGECACQPNREPWLVCVRCGRPTAHTFVGAREVRRQSGGVAGIESIFGCTGCGAERRWGYAATASAAAIRGAA